MKTTISFTLDSDADADILAWLAQFGQRERSAGIREALRDHLGRNGVTLRDVLEAVEALRRDGVTVAATAAEADDEIPDDIAASLNQLGL